MISSTLTTAWDHFLSNVKTSLSSPQDYHMWFEPIRPIDWKDGVLTVRVPSRDYYSHIESEYLEVLKESLVAAFGKVQLNYEIPNEALRRTIESMPKSNRGGATPDTVKDIEPSTDLSLSAPQPATAPFETHLDKRMNFGNFYESVCNRLAYTAGMTIVKQPGDNAFNPLFVHGHSGVGKTHIIHAIGNKLVEEHPDLRVVYIPAQTFMRQYVYATIKAKQPELFYDYYHHIDVLLMDDIQEIASATSTQNAFFQIFNNLKLLGKQIVITCDRAPSELKGFEDRLYSRLKWGLTVEIEQPDVELRRMILNKKVEEAGMTLPNDVFDFIVANATDNVRDIEGSLTSLMAYSLYNSVPLDIHLARRVMSQTVGFDKIRSEERKEVQLEDIIRETCLYYGVTEADIESKRRKRDIALARQMVMYLSKEYTDIPLKVIGQALGDRHHSTILYGHKTIRDLMQIDDQVRQDMKILTKKLGCAK